MPEQDEASSPQPIRFHRPHISQEPINDPEPKYVTRNRYPNTRRSANGAQTYGRSPLEEPCISEDTITKQRS